MKGRFAYALFALLIVASMVLAGCSSTPAAQPTAAADDTTGGAVEVKDNYVEMSMAADSCDYGGEFKSIETVDKYTVKITLCYSDPAFASKVAFSVFSIADKESLDAAGGDSIKMSEDINGTGPYTVKEWAHGDRIIFEANPNDGGRSPGD
jgi:ABC-type transport system substrate-binding protein